MTEVESISEIRARWTREGRTHRIGDAVAEQNRQAAQWKRDVEDAALAHPELQDPEYIQSIRDHREAAAAR